MRVAVNELATMIGSAAERGLLVFPVPDTALRTVGRLFDVIGDQLPFETPINSAAMQYYTQMPKSDDEPAHRDLGVTWRDPAVTIADTVDGLIGWADSDPVAPRRATITPDLAKRVRQPLLGAVQD